MPRSMGVIGSFKIHARKNIDARNAYQTALPLLEAQSSKPVSLMTGLVQVYIRLGNLYLRKGILWFCQGGIFEML